MELKRLDFLVLLFYCSLFISNSRAKVSISIENGLVGKVSLQNDLVKMSFKENATISSLIFDGINVAADNDDSFFLDWHMTTRDDLFYKPTQITIVENSTSLVHIYYTQESSENNFHVELHYVLTDGLSGVYSWAKYVNDRESTMSLGTTRTVYRFNTTIFTEGTNIVRNDTLYTYEYLKQQTVVQDETWQLPNGTVYTKYDFAAYLRQTPYQGVYGNGYGAFVISPSREYHNGGPLKQELTVHQDSLILNIFVGSHFGTPGLSAPPGWKHIYGPFLMYFNKGSTDAIYNDVRARVITEQNAWPYDFVNDDEYPTKRGSINGQISGQKNATIAICDSLTEEFDEQSLGYLFTTATDSNGKFRISSIRPGVYKLVAYPTAGQGSENVATKQITVTAGIDVDVGILDLPEPENIIWSLGETNRRANEFKYSNEIRNYVWQTMPPENLTFVIGEDKPSEGWYYAQTKPGTWTIQYKDTHDGKSRTVRVALAAASNQADLLIHLNGENMGKYPFENDKAIYRSALQSGHYHLIMLDIPSTKVVSGINNISFELSRGKIMYDAISLQIKEV